jgi:hypothetical protein
MECDNVLLNLYNIPTQDGAGEGFDFKDIGSTTVVPTVTVQRTEVMMESWIKNMEPFILVGPEVSRSCTTLLKLCIILCVILVASV